MHFYLSSYKIGDEEIRLKELFLSNNRVAYIPNALDFTNVDHKRRESHIEKDMTSLSILGLNPEILNLKDYFGNMDSLERTLKNLGGVWVSGGNVFVLRQAMKLSGFDILLPKLLERSDFVYGGYSAAGCVLSKKLDAYKIVDDATDTPYPELNKVVWEGIGILDFAFLPHCQSDHPESDDIDKEVAYCKENVIPYKTFRDGEVLIFEKK